MMRPQVLLSAAALMMLGYVGHSWWSSTRCQTALNHVLNGRDYMDGSKDESAIDLFDQAIQMCDSLPKAWLYRGEALLRLKELNLARSDIQHAIRLGLDERPKRTAQELLKAIDKAGIAALAPAKGAPAAGESASATTSVPPPPSAAVAAKPPNGEASGGSPPDTAMLTRSIVPLPPIAASSTPAAGRAEIEQAVARIFAEDKDARISSTTTLLLDAERLADAVPVAVRQALKEPDNRSGVINTLVLLQKASPATLRAHDQYIRILLARVEANGPQTAELVAKVRATMK